MSLEAILSKIREEARQKSESIIRAADIEKNTALEKHAEEIESKYIRDIEKVRAGIEEELIRKEFHVRTEAAREIQNARRAMIDTAIRKAVENLKSIGDSEYLKMISSLIEGCDLKGKVEVVISSADESRITPGFLKKYSKNGQEFVLSSERHSENGGVIFKSGKISQNGTFEMIADLMNEDMVMNLSSFVPLEKN